MMKQKIGRSMFHWASSTGLFAMLNVFVECVGGGGGGGLHRRERERERNESEKSMIVNVTTREAYTSIRERREGNNKHRHGYNIKETSTLIPFSLSRSLWVSQVLDFSDSEQLVRSRRMNICVVVLLHEMRVT